MRAIINIPARITYTPAIIYPSFLDGMVNNAIIKMIIAVITKIAPLTKVIFSVRIPPIMPTVSRYLVTSMSILPASFLLSSYFMI